MSAIKERIFGAVTVMSDSDAEKVWNLILDRFTDNAWGNIKEAAPDEWDKNMLGEISENPECREFISSEEAIKELGL